MRRSARLKAAQRRHDEPTSEDSAMAASLFGSFAAPAALPLASLSSASTGSVAGGAAKAAKEPALPPGGSEWDKLPSELHNMILKFAGPLTLLLCGRLGDKDSLDKPTRLAVWTDVDRLEWQGDAMDLPRIELHVGDTGRGNMMFVTARSTYKLLCRRSPLNASSAADRKADVAMNDYGRAEDDRQYTRLFHIPMRNGWFDLVDLQYPIALGWYAIRYGHTALLHHLALTLKAVDLKLFCKYEYREAMDCAADGGHLEILKMLHEAGNSHCTPDAMDNAAAGGHLDTVIWLHNNRSEGCSKGAMNRAAGGGHLHVVQWLHANRTEGCTKDAMNWAAAGGFLDTVQWLHAHRTEGCTTSAYDLAASDGHLDTLKWLAANRSEGGTVNAMTSAAWNGHLEAVQWLHEQRPEESLQESLKYAVQQDQPHVVEWITSVMGPVRPARRR